MIENKFTPGQVQAIKNSAKGALPAFMRPQKPIQRMARSAAKAVGAGLGSKTQGVARSVGRQLKGTGSGSGYVIGGKVAPFRSSRKMK